MAHVHDQDEDVVRSWSEWVSWSQSIHQTHSECSAKTAKIPGLVCSWLQPWPQGWLIHVNSDELKQERRPAMSWFRSWSWSHQKHSHLFVHMRQHNHQDHVWSSLGGGRRHASPLISISRIGPQGDRPSIGPVLVVVVGLGPRANVAWPCGEVELANVAEHLGVVGLGQARPRVTSLCKELGAPCGTSA